MERTDVVFDVVVEFVDGVFFVRTFVDMPRFKVKCLTKRYPCLIDGNHDLFSEIKIKKNTTCTEFDLSISRKQITAYAYID